ncbi:methyl-CpG-binding domain protein 3-like 2B [Oryctolagus cuniculus]|uniref:methyl-CpG-binding domain protein 3-like 2B n=1 Tax=Oryctolagus cuniculus TaxID=9986 RepID=UPI0038779246
MIIPETLQRKQVARVLKAKPRPREGFAQPVRLTSCIFKSLITRVSAHLGNVVQHLLTEGYLEKPQQVCALRQLQGLCASSNEGEPLPTLEFANSWKMTAPAIPSRSPGPVGAGGLQSRPKPTPEPSSKVVVVIPPADLGVSWPLSSWQVTPEDIKRQTRKVKELRRRLAEALQADKIIREEEKVLSCWIKLESFPAKRAHYQGLVINAKMIKWPTEFKEVWFHEKNLKQKEVRRDDV